MNVTGPVVEPDESRPAGTTPTEVAGPETTADGTTADVMIRRSPRYGRFMLLGALIGVFAAIGLTLAAPNSSVASVTTQGIRYDLGQVFGFLLIGGVAIGTVLGAAVALIIDRVFSGRAAAAKVAHTAAKVAHAEVAPSQQLGQLPAETHTMPPNSAKSEA